MHRLKMKIACLYCLQCAEQIMNIMREKFKISNIEVNMQDQIITIFSYKNIERIKLAKEIRKRGYGSVVFITNKSKR